MSLFLGLKFCSIDLTDCHCTSNMQGGFVCLCVFVFVFITIALSVLQLEFQNGDSNKGSFIVEIVFDILGFLLFQIYLQIALSNSVKN